VQVRALSFAEKRDWLRLSRTPRVGPVAFRDLLVRYKTAGAALEALPSIMRRKASDIPPVEAIEAEMEQSEQMGVQILAACEADYPVYLRAVDPCPPLISLIGRPNILHQPCIAIVGSRNSSAIGQRFARQISGQLGEAGYTVVSGLARGIDASAHSAALPTGTAAVLGGGVDHIYPRQNTESMGVVVIEAAERSGTLITARYALEQNREVMAAPGSPLDPRTKGCNRLIQQGAALIENVDDIIASLENVRPPQMMEPSESYNQTEFNWDNAQDDINDAKIAIESLLSPTPTPRDEIIRQSGFTTAIATAAMLEMELSGDALVEPDGRIALNPSFD